jgi:two-component system response regulator YesN
VYKVIVIDDEPKVRRGLSQLIPKLDPDWVVVGEAKNGIEGLQMIKNDLPDLVITDIRMPRMNGLDLLNDLRNYSVYVVVLSGYGYFEYAQTAIKFGAFEYLLKPMKSEEILNVLTRVKKLRQTESAKDQNSLTQADLMSIWREWLMEPADYKAPPVQITPFFDASFQVVLIEIDTLDELVTEDQWGNRQLVMFAVRNIISDVVQIEAGIECTFMLSQGSQLFYLVKGCSTTRLLAENMIKAVRKWIKIYISIGISEAHLTVHDVHSAVQQAREAIQNKWIYGFGSVSEYADFRIEDALSIGYPISLEEALIVAVKSCQNEKALNILDQFMNAIIEAQMTFRLFRRFYLQLTASLIHVLYEYKIYDVVLKNQVQPYELLVTDVPLKDLHEGMKQLIVSSVEAIEWTKTQKNQRAMERALEYIHEYYMNDISLDDVSGSIQMSAGYFSTFFKQEIGSTFIDYLTRLRVDKAKQLMANPGLRIYEISEMVGYQDSKYFSRVFKRVLGVSPAEYREFFFRKEGE